MGSCFSSGGSRGQGHTLGGGSSTGQHRTTYASQQQQKQPQNPQQPNPGSSSQGSSNSKRDPPNRDALLAAAESRAQSQAHRGVQSGGGRLAEKLESEKRKSATPTTAGKPGPDLVWD